MSAATTEAAPLPPVSGAAFVRQSSGLVKLGTPWRILVMAVTVNGIGLFMANFYLTGPGTFPHMNLIAAVLFACSAQFLFNGAYALLAGAFPRSGGEYVYISRVLGPFVGFVANVGAYIAFCFYAAVGAFLCVTFGLSPLLAVYGVITDASWASSAGTWLADTNHALIIGTAIVIASTVLCCFSMRVYYRYQAITWWAGMTCFVVLLVVMLVSSHADFVHGLNAFGQKTGAGANVYDAVTANAHKAGVPSGYTLWATLSMAALLTTVTPTGYVGGEVRTPLRTQLTGMLGGTAIIAAIFLIVPLLISHVVGLDWNKDAAFLNSAGEFPVSQTPLYTFYAFVLTTSPVLLIVMGLGLLLLTAILVPQQIFMPTRMIFGLVVRPARAAAAGAGQPADRGAGDRHLVHRGRRRGPADPLRQGQDRLLQPDPHRRHGVGHRRPDRLPVPDPPAGTSPVGGLTGAVQGRWHPRALDPRHDLGRLLGARGLHRFQHRRARSQQVVEPVVLRADLRDPHGVLRGRVRLPPASGRQPERDVRGASA